MLGWLKKGTSLSLDRLAGMVGWMSWGTGGVPVTLDTSIQVPAVFCAARTIAEGCAQVPVRVVKEVADGAGVRREIAADHPVHKLLAVRPNSWQTSYEFREGMVLNAVLGAGAVAIKNFAPNGKKVLELLPVPAGCWTVDQTAEWELRLRVDFADKTHETFDLRQVFYFRGPGLDGIQAVPAIRAAREAIGLSLALEKQQAKLAANGGKPSGVLAFDGKLAPETREKLRATWEQKFGYNGDGGIAVIDQGAKWLQMTMTSVDAQHLETRRFQIEEVARAFRVQPIMLMQADKAATYASAEQMFRMHVIHTLTPWMVRFEQAATRDLLADEPDLRVDLDERGLMRGDFKDQSEYFTKALGAGGQPGWMSVNEVRAEIGLDPVAEDWAKTVPRGAMNGPAA